MQPFNGTVINRLGVALSGISVLVTDSDTGQIATIYSDNIGTVQANPMTTDLNGSYAFRAADGEYTITESGANFVTRVQSVLLEDPKNLPSYASAVNVFEFMSDDEIADVMAGTLVYDTQPRVVQALATGKPVLMAHGSGWKYKFGATLPVPSNSVLYGDGAQIVLASGVNNHAIRCATDATNIEIRGLRIDGKKSTNTGGHGIAVAGGSNIRILNNYVQDCGSAGIYLAGTACTNVVAKGNSVTGCVSGGITANDFVYHFGFNENQCWLNGTHGVGILGTAKIGTINDNNCWDNGQGTPNADNITGYAVTNEDITVSGNACSGGLNNGIHMGGIRITVANNIVEDPTQYGIAMNPSSGLTKNFSVTGNVINSAGVSGIWMENCQYGTVSGNTSSNNAGHGVALDACLGVAVTGNTLQGNGASGINNGTASSFLAISGNTIQGNTLQGIAMGNLTDSAITGNAISSNTQYGINVSGTEARNNITGNVVRANTVGQIAQPNVSTRVAHNDTGVSRSINSAAALAIPPGGEYFYVLGTTSITSMTASWTERRVTLQFDAALTVTDGGNLSLAGNYVTVFKSTLSLIFDGTNWIETSRSNN